MEQKDFYLSREVAVLRIMRVMADSTSKYPDLVSKHVYHAQGIAEGLNWAGGIEDYQLLNIRNIANAYMNGGRA